MFHHTTCCSKKVEKLEIRCIFLKIIAIYLSDRQQYVKEIDCILKQYLSLVVYLKFSYSAHLFIIIYVNDVPKEMTECDARKDTERYTERGRLVQS